MRNIWSDGGAGSFLYALQTDQLMFQCVLLSCSRALDLTVCHLVCSRDLDL